MRQEAKKHQKRQLEGTLRRHLGQYRQMAFISGPRQVGKTTLCKTLADVYWNWDNEDHRERLLQGPKAIADASGLSTMKATPPVLLFDELHKYRHWKNFLKGFFDSYADDCRILVTGSSRLDVYQRGGDSLMGRYFPYRMHPFTTRELTQARYNKTIPYKAQPISESAWNTLYALGGFPEPYLMQEKSFHTRWYDLRRKQLLREDIRDMTRIQELDQLAILERILSARSGEQLIYSSLAKQVRVSEVTIRSWINTLCSLHHGFIIRPWHRNLNRALRKEPKWYLRDWSGLSDEGKRNETMVACHLLKCVESWTDEGRGAFDLHYLRDKEKREVDFLITKDDAPWILVEVKTSEESLSQNLSFFKKALAAPYAFQIVMQLPYADLDCFKATKPMVVPAKTFLSQCS